MGWIRPTSHDEPKNQWHNPSNCYDSDLTTYGYDDVYGPPFSGYYIEFNVNEIQCNRVRFNARSVSGDVDKIDIDVYYNGAWHNVFYRGHFSSKVWVEVSLDGTYAVTKARVRFFNSDVFFIRQGRLYEFNFYEIASEVGWINEPYAYDNNTGSEASCTTPKQSWTPWLVRGLSEAVYSSVVRFYAQYDGIAGIKFIDLNVYYDGAWHDVFEGSYINKIWIEKALGDTYFVSKIAVRFYNASLNTVTAYIQEMQFVESAGVPKVTTNAATAVEEGKATLNGNITCTGGVNCTTRGFKYKEGIGGAEQDISDSGSFSTGTFSKDLSGLDPTKKYYFKAYATNTSGTGYGDWKSFGEDIAIPTVTTSAASSIDYEKAVLNGNITDTGGEDPEERGFQYKIGAETTIRTIRETGSFGVGAYSLDFDGLDPNVEYHFRAYAKNGGGTAYGSWLDFTTEYTTSMVKTHNATNELTTQVTGNGEIVSTGGQDCNERGFEYGLSKVATWLKNEVAGGYGVGFFDIAIDGLTANTEYWYRAYAKFLLDSDISQLTTSNFSKFGIQFQVYNNKIYLIWREIDSSSYPQIWTGIMDLDGTNFVATKRTTSSVHNKIDPQLQVVGDKIYYVWIENLREVWTAKMDIDGSNFVAVKRETNTTDTRDTQFQVVGSTIYYVWHEADATPDFQIWTAKMGIDGSDWTATKRTTTAYDKFEVQFHVVNDMIYFVYTETSGLYRQIWTATMTIEGASWSAAKKTTGSGTKQRPQLEVVGNMIYYVFLQQAPSYPNIFTAFMGTDGSDWTATQRTDFGAWSANLPQLQVVGNVIHYTFTKQLPSGGGSNYHIYSAQMNINGTNWTQEILTITEYPRSYPQFQVVNGILYYIWIQTISGYNQLYTLFTDMKIGYGEWLKFITAAVGTIPTGTKKVICSDYSGYTYRTQASETDDGHIYIAYFVISTDLTNKRGLAYYKRILDLHLYFKSEVSGTAKVEVKRDSEPAWQEVGEVTLTGIGEILVKHLAPKIRAKHFLLKISATNKFKFLGCLFESIKEGKR